MWKDSFITRLRVFLALFMLLVIVNAALVITSSNGSNDITQIKADIINIEYIFLFIIFLFAVMLFFYIPLMLNRKLIKIHHLLREITEGNYYPDIDMKQFDQDKEFLDFVSAIQKMLKVVVKFDQLKAEKITEHNNRIIGLLNLACNGFIIVSESGDVIYTNDQVKDNFMEFQQNTNFYDDIYSADIEKLIKPYVIGILRSGSKGKDQAVQFESLKLEIIVKSYIVRDENGEPTGAIIALYGLPGYRQMLEPQDL
jgi:signal transduction histidine kinase